MVVAETVVVRADTVMLRQCFVEWWGGDERVRSDDGAAGKRQNEKLSNAGRV